MDIFLIFLLNYFYSTEQKLRSWTFFLSKMFRFCPQFEILRKWLFLLQFLYDNRENALRSMILSHKDVLSNNI